MARNAPAVPASTPVTGLVRTLLRTAGDHATLAFFVAMHVACLLVFVYPPTWPLALLTLGSYLLRMWAVTVGLHRYFAHRSFQTSRTFQFVLGVLGATAMENGPIWWASWHRRHHKHVDTPQDPHSPLINGFWYSHAGWVFDPKNDVTDLSNVADLTGFAELRWIDRFSWVPLVAYALGCYVIAGMAGVVWGFVVSTMLVNHATFFINSVAHTWGSTRFKTSDTSKNSLWLALLTLGEGWHNNHHFYMSSARQGFYWWEIDVSYYTLKVLGWLGVVHNIRTPPAWVFAPDAVHAAAKSSDTE